MPTWGDHPASGRRQSPRHGSRGRRRTDRGRHRRGCGPSGAELVCMAALVLRAAMILTLANGCCWMQRDHSPVFPPS